MTQGRKATVLIAEDSKFDQMILKRAFATANIAAELRFVNDGEALVAYLQSSIEDKQESPAPAIVLLDLHMPRLNGREALRQIRQDDRLKHVPIIMLTNSDNEKHVQELYRIGANSYVVKPNSFDDIVATVRQLEEYWFGIAKLPRIA
jgi:two-component system response regulator